MRKSTISRRDFFGVSTLGVMLAASASALADPAGAAALKVGIKRGDLPDLTIRQVKVYALDTENECIDHDGYVPAPV
ncbi:MAG TPA: hypothetical protein VEN79_11925 [Terriglobia bacterium]|nr:hypothetical protein [Terriglobia bacterium]